jgi:hypothetical protein
MDGPSLFHNLKVWEQDGGSLQVARDQGDSGTSRVGEFWNTPKLVPEFSVCTDRAPTRRLKDCDGSCGAQLQKPISVTLEGVVSKRCCVACRIAPESVKMV